MARRRDARGRFARESDGRNRLSPQFDEHGRPYGRISTYDRPSDSLGLIPISRHVHMVCGTAETNSPVTIKMEFSRDLPDPPPLRETPPAIDFRGASISVRTTTLLALFTFAIIYLTSSSCVSNATLP